MAPVADDAAFLEQPTRRRILTLIQTNPGIKISRLCQEAEAGWGTVKYHLHLLQKSGLVVSRAKGRDCLLFPHDYPVAALEVVETMRQGRAGTLAREIARTPGANQKQLCERVRLTRKIIRRYVELLAQADLVTEERDAQYQRYYPRPRLVEHLGPEPQPTPDGPQD